MSVASFKAGLAKLIAMGAPQEDIDAFFEEEGVFVDERVKKAKLEQTSVAANVAELKTVLCGHIAQVAQQIAQTGAALAGEVVKVRGEIEKAVKQESANTMMMLAQLKEEPEGPDKEELMLEDLQEQVKEQQKELMAVKKMMNDLLTKRRIPEFDKDGNVIAVRLEA
jgi:hypothetical protein